MRIVSRRPSEAQPARIAPLSVLPVFLDLKGKRTIVTGGSDAAAWKAELLAAAGAEVHVHSPSAELSPEFAPLLADEAGRVFHHDASWNEDILAGAAVIVGDAEGEEEAAALAEAARRAGVPCNLIDRPQFCSFQFGSIVNRSPVVVGISSSGAAPILAQAIRRRVEMLLPHALAEWAALAQRLRGAVTERLRPGGERRTFWESFVDRALGPAPAAGEGARLEREVGRIAALAYPRGSVTLVATGPGEAEMLTLKAVRALQAADIIVFDESISAEVLELARREAKRIPVGGREEMVRDMADLARAGRRVVYLQPGDAASADCDIARLEAEGVVVGVVPGIAGGGFPSLSARGPAGREETTEPLPAAFAGTQNGHVAAPTH